MLQSETDNEWRLLDEYIILFIDAVCSTSFPHTSVDSKFHKVIDISPYQPARLLLSGLTLYS